MARQRRGGGVGVNEVVQSEQRRENAGSERVTAYLENEYPPQERMAVGYQMESLHQHDKVAMRVR